MSLLFNMLSRLFKAFLPRSKCLWISWLQSSSGEILEPPQIKSSLFPLFRQLLATKWWDWMPWSLFSECWVLSQIFHSPLSSSSRGVRGCSTLRDPVCCIFFLCVPFLKDSLFLSVSGIQEWAELHTVLRTEIMGKSNCLHSLQWLPSGTPSMTF